jgi:hypothetical protein
MTHTTFGSLRFLTLSAVLVATLPLDAADEVRVPWNQVCRAAAGNRLTVTTVDGATVEGYCMSINVDEMAISAKDQQRVVKIARTALARIEMQRSKNNGHQLRTLGGEMYRGLRTSFGWLVSPSAPLGIVGVPAIVAWGAVAAPFCLIGDLIFEGRTTQEIKVI